MNTTDIDNVIDALSNISGDSDMAMTFLMDLLQNAQAQGQRDMLQNTLALVSRVHRMTEMLRKGFAMHRYNVNQVALFGAEPQGHA